MTAKEACDDKKCAFCGSPALFLVATCDGDEDEDGDVLLDKIYFCLNCGHETQFSDEFYTGQQLPPLIGIDLGEVVSDPEREADVYEHYFVEPPDGQGLDDIPY